ncbi:hypothetical protein GCM10028784_32560 [Myceligenerans cantabricum]
MTQVDRGAGDAPSDAELIFQVRSGDREAFGALYTRHAAAARALARQYVKPGDAEDVVADAFSKLYEMLRRGAGPDSGFRTYLYTVVRHRAYDVSRGASRMRPTEDEEIEAALGRVASSEDPALEGFERSVVSRAYFALPERWREVLWYCLVDDLKPAQVAPVLGLTANGVSALLYRAKDALRDGYLQQHLTHAPSDTCRVVNPHLGGYVRDSLSQREKTRIESHLATCGTCSALVLELADVAHGMKCVVAPLVLGAAGLALVGSAIPLGASLAAAVKAASASAGSTAGASAGGGAASGAAAGASTGVGTTSVAAGTSTAAAGATAATAGASGAGTAAGVVGATAGATAVGVVGAGGAAATTGAIAAGAITVAAVGVVAALQLMGAPAEGETGDPDPVVVAATGIPTPPSSLPSSGTEPSRAPAEDATGPSNLLPVTGAEDFTLSFADSGAPLEPRRAQNLVVSVTNGGSTDVTGTTLRLMLPEGMSPAAPEGASGAGIAPALVTIDPAPETDGEAAGDASATGDTSAADGDLSAAGGDTVVPAGESDASASGTGIGSEASGATGGPAPSAIGPSSPVTPVRTLCTPGSEPGVVFCDVGPVGAGEAREVQVTVRAQGGGTYPIGAELRADGIDARSIALPVREVMSFGPELSAQTQATDLASPGSGVLPVRIGNTGDQGAAKGWSMSVTLPGGVRPAAAQEALTCTAGESRTWSCAPHEPLALAPGAWQDLALQVVAVPPSPQSSVESSEGTASVAPVGANHTQDARAQVSVTPAWTGASGGVGDLSSTCVATGGLKVAKAEVSGTYTNGTARTVSVELEVEGKKAVHADPLGPGERVTLRRDEGIRVPKGAATWVLSRTVEGVTYQHRVPAGGFPDTDCYNPSWESSAKAVTVNAGGRVGIQGTLSNKSDEPMRVEMAVRVKSGRLVSETKTVPPGELGTFTVATGQDRTDPGQATFRLARWTFDRDGDPPVRSAEPGSRPEAKYGRAVIAPSYTAPSRTMNADCTYDSARGASVGTFQVPVDNTGSTLPVTFRMGETTLQVEAGKTGTMDVRVPWGTDRMALTTTGGDQLATVDVTFTSCADVGWPGKSVEAGLEAQCVNGTAQVEAVVRNVGGSTWTGALVRPYSGRQGEEAEVPANGAATLVLRGPVALDRDPEVLVRLSREFEGRTRTVAQSHDVAPIACEPTTSCTSGSGATSWITAWFNGGCKDEDDGTGEQVERPATNQGDGSVSSGGGSGPSVGGGSGGSQEPYPRQGWESSDPTGEASGESVDLVTIDEQAESEETEG